jgi:pimeloyl-ACP methyl ester carboxylesterase
MNHEFNGINFSIYEKGEGDICLFLHGNRDRKEVFQYLIPYLDGQFHLIFLDLRGHGDTDAPFEGYSYDQFLNDINALIEYKEIRTFNLIGHSLGGVLSILYALKYPEKIKNLILMGTSAHFVPKFKRPPMGTTITEEMIKITNENAAPYFFLPEFNEVQTEILSNWSKVPSYVHEKMIQMGHPDLREKIKEIKKPTLLIVGEKDKICTQEDGIFIHEQIKGSELEVIKDSAHFMFMERPKEVSDKILSFLKKNQNKLK